MTPLAEWQNFYTIIGSAAGALTGLQFISMALIADLPLADGAEQSSEAFSTPSIVHFGVALLTAAVVAMPWHAVTSAATVLALVGACGLAYTAYVAWLLAHPVVYTPVAEDWFFRFVLPLAAYTGLAAAAVLTTLHPRPGLFTLAAVVLLLLFIGIHHAWDNVTYLVFIRRHELRRK